MQVVLVYFEWFRRNSLLKCVLQAKIAKNSLKPLFWGFKVVQGHRCWYRWKARRQCWLWYAASQICSLFHARWANSGKITISKGSAPLWCPCSRGTSSPSGTKLPHWKLETLGYHMVKTRSLYLTRLFRHRVVTDGQTDGQNRHS